MNNIKRLLIIAPVALLLAGCASDSKKIVHLNLKYITSDSAPVSSADTNAQSQLAEAATSVGHSLQQLSAVQEATHPDVRLGKPVNPKAIGMAHVASINWTGPVKPLLKRIASASNYRLNIIGSKPAIPVIVSINAKNQTLAEILRNVTYQVTNKATVKVYPRSKVVELRYLSN